MKRIVYLGVVLLAMVLAGCEGSTPPSEKPLGGGGGGRTELSTEFKVASDGVVRDASGAAYCVVMKQAVSKEDEAAAPSETVDGVKYVFCCKTCPGMFAKDKSKYLVQK